MRTWHIAKDSLAFLDEMRAEVRTREIAVTTYPVLKSDQPIYVFTPKDLKEHDREVALAAWNAAFNAIHHDDVDFPTYWAEILKEMQNETKE